MRIFLIGYMGSGKSRWGKLIAKHYGFRFIDLDIHIEEREKATIPEIFNEHEESGFRLKEQEALTSIQDIDNVIIATGGGAPCFHNNMETMNNLGTTLFIDCSAELLQKRISDSDTERPLVAKLSQDELLEYIKRHLKIRMPFYKQADYKIISGNLEIEDFIALLDPIINV